jgi:PhzF family phenazine biosynthesis protein
MKTTPFSLIAVFTDPDLHFRGNVAAVVMLKTPWSETAMQQLAADLNQPATSYLWPTGKENQYHVRWYAPDDEIGLCGHGSLAAVAFLSEQLGIADTVTLLYRDGHLIGKHHSGKRCSLTLAAIPVLAEEAIPEALPTALGVKVSGYFSTPNKHLVLVEKEADVKNMAPNFAQLRQLPTFGYAVTAPGEEADFVSRTLVPHVQQLEDPATGSSHAALAPFWAKRLQKNELLAYQLSARGGRFDCEVSQDQVILTGNFEIIASGQLQER